MAEPRFVVVHNEQEAWKLLEQALSNHPSLRDAQITFDNWPKLEILLKGRDLEGTLPARYLPALQEYQEAVYKIYSYVKYKDYSLRRLKDSEKQELELVFKVEKGSSEFVAPFADALQKIGLEAAARMSPTQITVFLCLVALLFGSNAAWARWLKYKEDKDTKDISNKAFDTVAEILKNNNRRDDLLVEAIRSSRATKVAHDGVDEAQTRLALSMDEEDQLVVDGARLEGGDLRRAAIAPRKASKNYSEEGPAYLTSVDNSLKQGYVVGVRMSGKGYTFIAKVDNTRLTNDEVVAISHAIFTREPIWIHIEGKTKHDKVIEAMVYSVRKLTQREHDQLESE